MNVSPAALVLIAGAGYALLRLLVPPQAPAAATGELGELRAQIAHLRAEQAAQAERLQALTDLVVLVLPDHEKTHLRNLRSGTATEYAGNHDVREALRHLRQLGLLVNDRPIDSINDGEVVNLHDFIRLTPLGEQWAQRVAMLDKG